MDDPSVAHNAFKLVIVRVKNLVSWKLEMVLKGNLTSRHFDAPLKFNFLSVFF